jgi:hypothetical protein
LPSARSEADAGREALFLPCVFPPEQAPAANPERMRLSDGRVEPSDAIIGLPGIYPPLRLLVSQLQAQFVVDPMDVLVV